MSPGAPRTGALIALFATIAGCSAYEPFESTPHVRRQVQQRLDADVAAQVQVPFELSPEVLADARPYLSPSGSDRKRVEEVVDFIFSGLDLQYSLTPTRNASDTYLSRQGNCLSFVNLFVGLAREKRLAPFYVEVQDYQRWNFKDGVVVSRGHIVAGINIDGNMRTYDFLPYRPKSYRDFEPVDDLTAMAHFYNNLGAEALMDGDIDRAETNLRIATSLAPDFEKAVNNLGVVLLRRGETEKAVETLERGLELYPASVPLLTNLARVKQTQGDVEAATAMLDQLEGINHTNPFFFVYRGEMALADGDTATALDYLRQALRVDSEVPEVHVGLTKLYMALGDLDRARHHIQRALRLDATHTEARKYAALLSAARGDGEER